MTAPIDLDEILERATDAHLHPTLGKTSYALLFDVPALLAELRAAREALAGWRHVRTAADGLPCWCLTEHAHHKYGCDDLRKVLGLED